MTETNSPQRSPLSTLLAGAAGGLIVLVLGATLIATDVIDTGDEVTRTVQATIPSADTPASGSGGGDGDDDEGGRTVADIYRHEGRGVVFIEADGVASGSPLGGSQGGTATGSGFVVDRQGTVITNEHVVSGASEVTVSFEEQGETIDAEVLGTDADSDLAVLRIDPSEVDDLQPLQLGDSSEVKVGDAVVAIGNPFGFTRTVTTGIVSAKQRVIEARSGFSIPNVIQTDAAINPGNSGGPLLDAQGRVIGINSQIATGGSSGSVGIGFAVPIDTVKELLPDLKRGEAIERAYLGINMRGVDEEIANDLNLPAERGVLVQEVFEDSPAAEAGIEGGGTSLDQGLAAGGDLIVQVDGEDIETTEDVPAAIADRQPGDTVEIKLFRGDEPMTVEVTLGKRPISTGGSGQQERQLPEGLPEGLPELP